MSSEGRDVIPGLQKLHRFHEQGGDLRELYYFDLSYERRNAIHELPGIVPLEQLNNIVHQAPYQYSIVNRYSKFNYFYNQRDETPDLTGIE